MFAQAGFGVVLLVRLEGEAAEFDIEQERAPVAQESFGEEPEVERFGGRGEECGGRGHGVGEPGAAEFQVVERRGASLGFAQREEVGEGVEELAFGGRVRAGVLGDLGDGGLEFVAGGRRVRGEGALELREALEERRGVLGGERGLERGDVVGETRGDERIEAAGIGDDRLSFVLIKFEIRLLHFEVGFLRLRFGTGEAEADAAEFLQQGFGGEAAGLGIDAGAPERGEPDLVGEEGASLDERGGEVLRVAQARAGGGHVGMADERAAQAERERGGFKEPLRPAAVVLLDVELLRGCEAGGALFEETREEIALRGGPGAARAGGGFENFGLIEEAADVAGVLIGLRLHGAEEGEAVGEARGEGIGLEENAESGRADFLPFGVHGDEGDLHRGTAIDVVVHALEEALAGELFLPGGGRGEGFFAGEVARARGAGDGPVHEEVAHAEVVLDGVLEGEGFAGDDVGVRLEAGDGEARRRVADRLDDDDAFDAG